MSEDKIEQIKCSKCQFYEPKTGMCTRKNERTDALTIQECSDYLVRETLIMFGG